MLYSTTPPLHHPRKTRPLRSPGFVSAIDLGWSARSLVCVARDELEDHGSLERVTDKADRRAKIIRLTDQGRTAQRAAARILADVEQQWSRLLGRDQVTMLRRALEQVIALEAVSTPTVSRPQ
jgi:hypothetical protein